MSNVLEILKQKGQEVWTTPAEATVFEALQTMEKKNVGALVVTEAGRPVGIFSERDYARKVALKNLAAANIHVREVMASPLYFVKPETTTEECMALMTEKRVRHLPVISEGKLTGIVSIGDIVKAVMGEHNVMIERLQDYILGKYT